MAPLQLLEQRDGVQLRIRLQQRHDLSVPHQRQRIGARAPTAGPSLRRQPVAAFDAPRAALADAGARGCHCLGVSVPLLLVSVHLVVRDPLAGHRFGLVTTSRPTLNPDLPDLPDAGPEPVKIVVVNRSR